ncbi:putative FHA domain protein SNIP1 [Aspergillus homomorphus CBS 101889]|uniref:SMAD/FHA domain-containing protein n=1 Tax=Aspergillus homomorphus (strain CBS 101889) TaxID=1450537 RepID=A0A395I6M3_ASPHC|nr:SMAD/FHA domain-containing protein [Aspergillus homomorphus CBS 101889]RAL15852.1 SMAD/FHA domain-containing protein [Aspergillus homomorphus CBS 101889]
MPDSPDHTTRRRHRSASGSPAPPRDRRERARDSSRDSRSRRHDSHRSSRRDSSRRRERRRSSRSPTDRQRNRRDDDHRRRDRERSPREDRDRRRRHRDEDDDNDSYRESSHRRRHRDRDDDRNKSSRRHRDGGRSRSRSPAPVRSGKPLPSQQDAYTSSDLVPQDGSAPVVEKEKANFGLSGRLAAESNTVNVNGDAVVLKYHEPPEARKPPAKDAWRLYVFKGQEMLEVVELNVRSCWLVGREHLVVDFPLEHPSCSKQHAAIQFRYVEKRNEYGDRIGRVKPYIIDLESANGTTVNGDAIPAGRFVEIRDKDVLQFGMSSREYVLMLPSPE